MDNNLEKAVLEAAKAQVLKRPFYYSSPPDKLIKNPKISLGAKVVYALMHLYSPKKNIRTENAVVEIALETIADQIGVNVKSAQKYVRELIETGWISRIKAGNQKCSSRYRLWPMTKSEFEGITAHIRIMERLKRDHGLRRRLEASLHSTGKKVTSADREITA